MSESVASAKTASAWPAALSPWVDRIRADLQPTPGRLGSSLRIVLTTIITLILLQALRMPQASLGLFFIFLVGRDSPAVSLRSGIFASISLGAAAALSLSAVGLSENDPIVRLLSVTVVAFIVGILLVSTTVGVLAVAGGLIYSTLIGLWENHNVSQDFLVKRTLYIVATVLLAIAVSVAVEYLFGTKDPVKELMKQRRIRYQALETMFSLFAQGAPSEQTLPAVIAVSRLASGGQTNMQQLYNTIVDRNLDPGILPFGTRVRLTMLAQLMDVSAAFATQNPAVTDPELQQRCAHLAAICRAIKDDLRPSVEALKEHGVLDPTSLIGRVDTTLHDILSMPAKGPEVNRELIALASSKVPVFIPGKWKELKTVAFALRVSLCATFCYIFYHAVDWPGISTCVTTVMVTALTSSGALKQKLLFRLIGSLIGGLILGLGATVAFFPHMDTLNSLVVLIGAVALLSAWVAAGRHFSYVGVQMAFAFYIVAFEDFSAPTELAPARDRFIGILLALIVMAYVFDLLWPVRTVTEMRTALAGILRGQANYLRLTTPPLPREIAELRHKADQLRDQIGKTAAGIRTTAEFIDYEFGVDREQHRRTGQMIVQSGLTSVGFFWNQFVVLHKEADLDFITHPQLAAMRRTIADGMDAMASSVVQGTAFPKIDATTAIDPALFSDPRYGEYARNSVDRFNELQTVISDLQTAA
ncbi:FUSC family protein [Edaphobacter bradus]|uniref:FUSC family protein n=1 Tax=Edaphobacter bradus TaxID=2259016 RepID=UPI0021DFBDC8|nr:FUSC family protein [Edaphobacter bradus]